MNSHKANDMQLDWLTNIGTSAERAAGSTLLEASSSLYWHRITQLKHCPLIVQYLLALP